MLWRQNWSAQEKATFLDLFKSDNKRYIVVDSQSPNWEAFTGKPAPEMQVVGLTAASYQK